MGDRRLENRPVRVRIRSTGRTRPGWEPVLVGLLGGVLGILFSCCLGIAALSLMDTSPEVTPAPSPPVQYDIEAIVEERYINRALTEGAAGSQIPDYVATGHVNVRPDGLMDFAVKLAVGPLRPVVRGTAALRVTKGGELEVTLKELEVGRLSLVALVPDRLLATMNDEVNRQLVERTTDMGVRLVGIASDETTLRLYLSSAR